MHTNITLKVQSDLAREAKVLAAQRGISLSRLLAMQLEEMVRRERCYEVAMRRSLARLEDGFNFDWTPPENRGELYER